MFSAFLLNSLDLSMIFNCLSYKHLKKISLKARNFQNIFIYLLHLKKKYSFF